MTTAVARRIVECNEPKKNNAVMNFSGRSERSEEKPDVPEHTSDDEVSVAVSLPLVNEVHQQDDLISATKGLQETHMLLQYPLARNSSFILQIICNQCIEK